MKQRDSYRRPAKAILDYKGAYVLLVEKGSSQTIVNILKPQTSSERPLLLSNIFWTTSGVRQSCPMYIFIQFSDGWYNEVCSCGSIDLFPRLKPTDYAVDCQFINAR